MDRREMIERLESARTGKPINFETEVTLSVRGEAVYKNGKTEVPFEDLPVYEGCCTILLVEGESTEFVERVKDIVRPKLTIVEVRSDCAETLIKLRNCTKIV